MGTELHNREVRTLDEFSKLVEGYSSWSYYKLEFLKPVFEKENNEYLKIYEGGFSIFAWNQRFNFWSPELLQVLKEKINTKISNLKKIRTKTELLEIKSDFFETESKVDIFLQKEFTDISLSDLNLDSRDLLKS